MYNIPPCLEKHGCSVYLLPCDADLCLSPNGFPDLLLCIFHFPCPTPYSSPALKVLYILPLVCRHLQLFCHQEIKIYLNETHFWLVISRKRTIKMLAQIKYLSPLFSSFSNLLYSYSSMTLKQIDNIYLTWNWRTNTTLL